MFLDRLVRIGIGAERDGSDRIAGLRQCGMKQLGSVRLGEQTAFEIDAWRQVVEGMGRPGEAIDAAMLAPAIGVDRPVEAEIRGTVPRDYGLRPLNRDRGPPWSDPVKGFDLVQPIAVGDALLQVEARRRRIAGCPAPTARLDRPRTRLVEQ